MKASFKLTVGAALVAVVLFAGMFIVGCSDDDNEDQQITFYCPAECEAVQGTNRPSVCFPSREECLSSVDPDNPIGSDGTFTDSRDNQVYRYVTIGTQVWMAENLNFETSSGSWCYDDEASNCDIYGRLYDWATVMNIDVSYNSTLYGTERVSLYERCTGDPFLGRGSCVNPASRPHRGVCPEGWHLPTDEEWWTLLNFVGGMTKLKSETGWYDDGSEWFIQGTDDFGFSALPGGGRLNDSFSGAGLNGIWRTTTEFNASNAWGRAQTWGMGRFNTGAILGWHYKTDGFPVRCVRD